MGMTIKSDETQRLIRELADLTGESQTAAVDIAVRERLARLRHDTVEANAGGLAERLLDIGKNSAARMQEPFKSLDHGELLYDERGLPKGFAE